MADKYDAILDGMLAEDGKSDKYDAILDELESKKQAIQEPKKTETGFSVEDLFSAPGAAAIKSLIKRYKGGYILDPEEEKFVRKTLQGASSGPIMGAVQLGADALGYEDVSNKILQNRKEGNTLGSLMQPEAWLSGKAIPQFSTATKQALTLGGMGAAYGALSPNASVEDRIREGATIGTIGATIPVVGKAASTMRPFVSQLIDSIKATFSKTGSTAIGQRMALNQLTPAERSEVLSILSKNGVDTSSLGSQLTTAQTLANANVTGAASSTAGSRLASFEDEIAGMRGGGKLNSIYSGQEANRQSFLDTLSGGRGASVNPNSGMSADDIALEAAKKERGSTAKKLYPSGNVTGDENLNEIMSRPGVRSAMGIEEKSAENVPRITQIGDDIPARSEYAPFTTDWQQTPYRTDIPKQYAQYSIKSLQNQYRLMDKEITRLMKTGASTDESRAYELMSAKRDLGDWLSKESPEWAQANRIFAFQSSPVKSMDVGAELKRKMAQSPSAFLKATEDLKSQGKLIRGVTGRKGESLTDIFKLGDMSKISGLRNEAQIVGEVEKLKNMARADLGDEKAFQLPNLLNVWVAIANRIARTAAKATVDDVTNAAAQALSDPALMRKILIEDAAQKAAAMQPISSAAMQRVAVPTLMSGGMMTGDRQ